jgi:poly-beta-1,6-N-acetyl-D-glucosamine synthase
MPKVKKIVLSVGVFAYNEEANIEQAILSLKKQEYEYVTLKEIIVVSSGSWDKTNSIVRKLSKKDARIKLLIEPVRAGKSAAINLFLRKAKAPILVTMSGDLKLAKHTLEEIGQPFLQPEVGMVGAHPVPKGTQYSQVGREVRLLWELHHQISLSEPKCGEVVAFRNIVQQIPHDSAVDEATLEVLLRLVGYTVVYAPKAIVYNKGPKTIKEFLIQRRRVQAGHQWVAEKYNYEVVTMKPSHLFRVVLSYFAHHPTEVSTLIRLISLEIAARFLGSVDYFLLGRNPYVWQMIGR